MGIQLNMFEEVKYKTIKKVANGQLSKERAEVNLDLSRRQINRLVKAYKGKGKIAFQHGNYQRKPSTTLPKEMKENILDLYQNKYKSFNLTHFVEKLVENEKITVSYTTVRNLLLKNHILSPRAFRKTKRLKRKELKNIEHSNKKLSKQESKLLNEIEGVHPLKAHPSRARKKYFGELLQMDASRHDWFKNGGYAHLHAAIDDATGTVVGAYFTKEETLNGYYEISRQFLNDYGIPYELLTDNRTVFQYKKEKNPSEEKDSFTQYGYACHSLGIKLTTTSIPETKGKIERLWSTFQDRLLNEMVLLDIQSMDQANQFLLEYLPKYNKKFAFPLKDTKSVFEKLAEDTKLEHILARFSRRSVQNGHSIKYQNKQYHLYNEKNQVLLHSRTKIMVIETLDHQLYASYGENIYQLKEIPLREKHSKAFDEPIKPKVKTIYIPPQSHPWKKASYERYLRKKKMKEASRR
ncbi:MAG: ISNCY family transposase [Lactococcus lactis]|nr:ISNCY family transposase [Lactococcus lactis]